MLRSVLITVEALGELKSLHARFRNKVTAAIDLLTGAFVQPPAIRTIPSWEEVPGEDGRHPPQTRLDPVGACESLEQLVALGYIAKPDEDRQKAVADTIAELRYNLGEAYQDADRHAEALEIFRELHQNYPDEQRHAVHRFVSAQALEFECRSANMMHPRPAAASCTTEEDVRQHSPAAWASIKATGRPSKREGKTKTSIAPRIKRGTSVRVPTKCTFLTKSMPVALAATSARNGPSPTSRK